MTVAWVLGSGGLLGSALCRSLRCNKTELFYPDERFAWGCEHDIGRQLVAAVQAFSNRICTARRWEIYWAAGVGTMSSLPADLALETQILSLLLDLIDSTPQLAMIPGAIAFCSSAGAIYAGSKEQIITEATMVAPTTPYANEKIRQEELIRTFARAKDNCTVLLARISTVYGPGQSSGKQQGLLTHIARSIIRKRPIQIYVPLDTIRDYIDADDASSFMVASLRLRDKNQKVFNKIIASEQPITIAEIISIFKHITRHSPKIITSTSRLTNVYSHRIRFRSLIPQVEGFPKTTLVVGIAKVMAAERAAYQVVRYEKN